ncbi:hypothetical protein [Paenibacillus sp. FSL M7-0420]|uniref:hypothetical protein n=1 Tax=Paenibacillus sp. FSL M7-0420 TaxID=2921609 RepID=UPI0030FBA619
MAAWDSSIKSAGSGPDGKMKGINPIKSAGSGPDGKMKGINPIKSAGSGPDGKMKGINPIKSAGSGPDGEMKGINPIKSAGSGPDGELKGAVSKVIFYERRQPLAEIPGSLDCSSVVQAISGSVIQRTANGSSFKATHPYATGERPLSDFFVSFLAWMSRFPLKQRCGRNDCVKAEAVAFVSGFSPLRGMKKIWTQQRLEQRSVCGAST